MLNSRRSALLALVLLAPVPSLGAAAAVFFAPGPVGALWTVAKCVLYGFPVVWLLAVDRTPIRIGRPPPRGLLAGLGSGLAIAAAVLLAWFLFGRGRIDSEGLQALAVENGFGTPLRYALLAAWLALGNSLAEEYVFRWFVLSRASRLVRPFAAVLLGSAIFTAHHVVLLAAYFSFPVVLTGSAAVFAAGAIWSGQYLKHGSVFAPWVSHVLADVAMLCVGADLLFGIFGPSGG